jgi:hypothetical protein
MRFRWLLVVLPVSAAIAVAVGALALAGSEYLPEFYYVELALVELTGVIGSFAAASRFARADYLRRAWTALGLCSLLLLIGHLTLTSGPFSDQSWAPLANGILTVVANAGPIVGTWMLAHAWRVAGLDLPGSVTSRFALRGLFLALALAAAGAPTVIELRGLLDGHIGHLENLASCVGDIITFSMIAPMLLTAIALRGGHLAWPFALLTASLMSWLCSDALFSLAPLLGASEAHVKVVLELLRALAFTLGGAAGFAQRLVANAITAPTGGSSGTANQPHTTERAHRD